MWNKLTIQQAQEIDRILKQNAPPLDIEVELIAIINHMSIDEVDSLKWAEYTELRKSLDFLNSKPDGKAMDRSNDITKTLNKVFGKAIGSSMLRHIFLTDKYSTIFKTAKIDAEKMGHSTEEQKNYIKEKLTVTV